ncbi:beta-ketoacyl synthase [Nonomuraea sp. NPDC050404]|uniref:beta-ketoacyl synthase n=1 Tax=Nonomuraea sp. NPDC050404 TaxID=3155783 RepID=UPI0033E5F32B
MTLISDQIPTDELISFDGQAFDVLAYPAPAQPPATVPDKDVEERGDDNPVAAVVRRIRAGLMAAHASALATQEALQHLSLATAGAPTGTNAEITDHHETDPAATLYDATVYDATVYAVTVARTENHGLDVLATPLTAPAPRTYPEPETTEGAFKPLAATPVTRLGADDLRRLRDGDVPGVFGTAYDQDGCNPEVRLSTARHGLLTEVKEIVRRAGTWNNGSLRASCALPGAQDAPVAAVTEAVVQAAQVFALGVGLHLCLAGVAFEPGGAEVELAAAPTSGEHELLLEVSGIDLIPRPWLTVEAELLAGGAVVARVRGLKLELRERPGTPVGPEEGGVVPAFLGRKNATGERALLGEFHMIHSSRGDLTVPLGPEFARSAGRRATRMPSGGLRLCDRLMSIDGVRHDLTRGVSESEYDSHADSWYYLESAGADMPNVILMETSLQSALLMGYHLGATLTDPEEDFVLRNLDGTATLLRHVDLRGRTIRQRSELLNTSVLKGAVLQNFSYELSVDGEPFYRGESLFGFFSQQALANQTGLDGGRYVPTWLDRQQEPPRMRRIEVGMREPGGPPASIGHLRLLDDVWAADEAGEHGKGYLRAVRPVGDHDWFFRRHFHLDPVMPGSLGVEAVLEAMREWLVDSGLAAHLRAPEFVQPAGLALSWRYRGQILATDGEMTLEVHIKDVLRDDRRVRVVGDASVWKPGLRIYALQDVAIELREAGS